MNKEIYFIILIKINFKKSNIDRLANANDQINQLNAENEEKRKLISRLEADIINFQIDNRVKYFFKNILILLF